MSRYSGLIADHATSLIGVAAHRLDQPVRELVAAGFTVRHAVLAVDSVLPDVRSATIEIIDDTAANLDRELAIVLDGAAARLARTATAGKGP